MAPDDLGLVPAPVSLETGSGTATLGDGARVASDTGLRPAARWWRRVTEAAFGVDLVPDDGAVAAADVSFVLVGRLPPGGYRLTITPGPPARVRVEAADLDGAHAAAQTLRQLAGPGAFRRAPVRRVAGDGSAGASSAGVGLPAVTIDDHPRFAHRGVLLDVARHFLPRHDVLRFVDLAAAHKLNVLQLHLTDDQGWRFEVHRYPELTQAGAWRAESTIGTWRTGTGDGTPHGGFYTQDDLREIVAYARERGVTVVPEIDVPGHVEAAAAAYPFLGTRKDRRGARTTWGISEDVLDPSDESLSFFRHVLDEVADVFDAPWIHLGGDEVPPDRWERSPDIRARAASLGFTRPDGDPDVARLHGWFVARLADHVRDLGRRAIVWDEAFGPDLPRDVAVMAWRSGSPGVGPRAAAAGHDVVVAPETAWYLDHRAGEHPDEPIPVGFLRTVEDVLSYDPGAAAVPHERLLGGQAQVWTEHLDSARRVDYATFPRLAAVAEVLWSPAADRAPGTPSSAAFLDRLAAHHLPRLDALGVEYRPLDGPRPWQRRPGVPGAPRDLARETAEARATETRPHGADAGAFADHHVRTPTTTGAGVRGGRPPAAEVTVVRGARLPLPDGSLSEPVDLHLADGRVARVAPAGAGPVPDGPVTDCPAPDGHAPAGPVLDADGRIALPGLIDAHSHAEGTVFDPDVQLALLRQGVTTVVTGQDGVSYAPGDGSWPAAYFAAILGDHPRYRGPRVRDLLAGYDGTVPVNVAYLAPHGTIRHAVLGGSPKRATKKDLARLRALLRQALADGACGLSTGLEYVPGGYADERELVTLAEVVAKRGLPHVSHMRGYEDKAGDAFAELVRVARASGAATHVSHYHGPAAELAGYVDEARAEGLDVTFDSYPYLRGCSILAMVSLPSWLPLADPEATAAALRDPAVVARLRREHFPALAEVWPRVTFASVPDRGHRNLTWAEGRTLPDVAGLLGLDPAGAVIEILVATGLRATCVFAQPPTNSAESVRALANHAAHLGGSDAIYLGGRPHPRGWGAFARMLAEHVGSGDWSWHDAAEHLSARAARRFGLAGRGTLTAGSVADVVLVDPDALRDRATYDLPRVVASGIDDVLVRGVRVLSDGHLTGATPGRPARPG
ncbi:family 20 glycosylhydrolase [Myceligenerans xiligouense]|uniref:beta-N-acetylhexosaminidase n=1 Tax=Myceligenerans xiligouense TaxID=253184 RepID=A0A3N4YQN9_9MICO|nr:family 20 glycosylhydrolase [Myceligenerans xiligouense]RPF22417.1 N-acetyl-beta-hexosaminidase [Myceligenerans xiligouense]